MQKFLLAVALSASSVVLAQKAQGVDPVRPTQVIHFEDDLVEGDPARPDVQEIEVVRGIRHCSLIQVRSEFKAKALQSADEL